MDMLDSIKRLYGITGCAGYTDEDIAYLKQAFGAIPETLELYYRTFGRTKEVVVSQNSWLLPEDYKKWDWLIKGGHFIFFVENQGVCCCGIRREELCLPNPPVYVSHDETDIWELETETLEEFLLAANFLHASLGGVRSISEADRARIQNSFARQKPYLRNWLYSRIDFYSNDLNGMIAIMGNDWDTEAFYSANTLQEFQKLEMFMEDIGVPV